jgi:hypothetical protein
MTVQRQRGAALRTVPLVAAILAIFALTSCGTPQPAKELASQGAVVADKAQGEMEGFIRRATQAYMRREAIVQELAEGETRDVAARDFRAWIAAESGASDDKARTTKIHEIAEQSRSRREKLVKAPAKSLGEAKQGFMNLAQELTSEEWLKFSWGYVKQVQTDLKTLKDQTDKAADPK